jgi:hypothetical protein
MDPVLHIAIIGASLATGFLFWLSIDTWQRCRRIEKSLGKDQDRDGQGDNQ